MSDFAKFVGAYLYAFLCLPLLGMVAIADDRNQGPADAAGYLAFAFAVTIFVGVFICLIVHGIILTIIRERAGQRDLGRIARPGHEYFAASLILPTAFTLVLMVTSFPMDSGADRAWRTNFNMTVFTALILLPLVALAVHWLVRQVTKVRA